MGDLKSTVTSIGNAIPGYSGYQSKDRRRDADRILRERLTNQYNAQRDHLTRIQQDAVRANQLTLVSDLESANQQLSRFISRLRVAPTGYAGWFEYLVGGVEIGAGLLLLWPRMAWRAAAVLVVVMCGAVVTHLNAGEPVQAILPAVLLVPIILVGYRRHPRATLRARLQAAVNWVADRELAEEQRRQTTGPHSPRFLRSPDTSRSQTLPY